MLMVNDRVETAGLPDGRPTVAVVMAPLDAQTPSDRVTPPQRSWLELDMHGEDQK